MNIWPSITLKFTSPYENILRFVCSPPSRMRCVQLSLPFILLFPYLTPSVRTFKFAQLTKHFTPQDVTDIDLKEVFDCKYNNDCTILIQNNLKEIVSTMLARNFSLSTDSFGPIKNYTLSVAPNFNMSLSQPLCSKLIDAETRRDKVEIQINGLQITVVMDLSELGKHPEDTFTSLLWLSHNPFGDKISKLLPCFQRNFISVVKTLPKSLPNLLSCLGSTMVTSTTTFSGLYTTELSNVKVVADYLAYKKDKWKVKFAQLADTEKITFNSPECSGTPHFVNFCKCFVHKDMMYDVLSSVSYFLNVCLLQSFINDPLIEPLKCSNFV